jgi:hypothetical protein
VCKCVGAAVERALQKNRSGPAHPPIDGHFRLQAAHDTLSKLRLFGENSADAAANPSDDTRDATGCHRNDFQ